MRTTKLLALVALALVGGQASPVPDADADADADGNGDAAGSPSTEVPSIRNYFYIGGGYADDGTGKGRHIFRDQMYVEQLKPVKGKTQKTPIVIIHGQAQTGTVSSQPQDELLIICPPTPAI